MLILRYILDRQVLFTSYSVEIQIVGYEKNIQLVIFTGCGDKIRFNYLPQKVLNRNCCEHRCYDTNRQVFFPHYEVFLIHIKKLYEKNYLSYPVKTKVFTDKLEGRTYGLTDEWTK